MARLGPRICVANRNSFWDGWPHYICIIYIHQVLTMAHMEMGIYPTNKWISWGNLIGILVMYWESTGYTTNNIRYWCVWKLDRPPPQLRWYVPMCVMGSQQKMGSVSVWDGWPFSTHTHHIFVHGTNVKIVFWFWVWFPQNDGFRLCLLEQWVLTWACERCWFQWWS